MNRDQQRLEDYLAHILEAVERIERYTEDMDVGANLFAQRRRNCANKFAPTQKA